MLVSMVKFNIFNKFTMVPNYGDTNDLNVRAKYGYLEGWVSIAGNSILFILKLILCLYINSIALIADAFHTLSDVGTSGVVIFGFKISKKQPDKKHPFGHGRVEYVSTLIIAILLVITGLGFIQQSIGRIIKSATIVNQEFAVIIGIIVIISSVVKELMAQFSFSIGEKIKSDILIADAWHHRSDVFASIGVGISIIASTYGFPRLDPIFGIIVSMIIIYVGVNLVRMASHLLIGLAPDREIVAGIKNIASSIVGIKGIHDVSIHDYGTSKVISLHAEVENDLSLDEAHAIADNIEDRINREMNYSTIVHLEPKEMHLNNVIARRIIEEILEKQKDVISFHKIQIIRRGTKEDIKVHIIVDKDMSIGDSHELCHRLEFTIRKGYASCNMDIHLEPCGKDCEVCTFSCEIRGQA